MCIRDRVVSGADSRTGIDIPKEWCRVLTELPPRQGTATGYLMGTERPLTSHIISSMIEPADQNKLEPCVTAIRDFLLQTKSSAWRKSPIFQLCQLMRSTTKEKNRSLCSHRLVGEHFGHFELLDGKIIERSSAKLVGRIRMPEAEREPLIFLALTSWLLGSSSPTRKRETNLCP